jgi:hypothetical protein
MNLGGVVMPENKTNGAQGNFILRITLSWDEHPKKFKAITKFSKDDWPNIEKVADFLNRTTFAKRQFAVRNVVGFWKRVVFAKKQFGGDFFVIDDILSRKSGVAKSDLPIKKAKIDFGHMGAIGALGRLFRVYRETGSFKKVGDYNTDPLHFHYGNTTRVFLMLKETGQFYLSATSEDDFISRQELMAGCRKSAIGG